MDVTVTTENGITTLVSPYNPDMPAAARKLGGRFDRAAKAWRFDARDEERVRDLARRFYGTDGTEPEGDLVTVRVELWRCEGPTYENFATFAGRRIAERPHRDARVRLAANVVLVEGKLPSSGGSMRYPEIDAPAGTYVEIRDLPRASLAAADREGIPYEIVEEQGPDVDALLAERERLLQRLAEIDAQLPEPEGTEASTREAAAALGVSVRTVQRWAQQGKVEARKDARGHWVVTITIEK